MGQIREVDAITDAIIETEKEIAGAAFDIEETSSLDETGDRGLEAMGDGLEGQHEQDDDEDADGETEGSEETDGEEGSEGEDGEGEGEAEAAAQAGKGNEQPKAGEQKPEGRVPSGKLREAAERARVAEAERDALKAQIEASKGESPKIAALEAQLAQLTQILNGQRQQPVAKEEPAKPVIPDIFENPDGFRESIVNEIKQAVGTVRGDLRKVAVETSFELAHVRHGDTFPEAMQAIEKLNPQNPDDRAIVQRIYNAPNPGEALVSWHKRNKALAVVGDDPLAYAERVREETRQSLLKDPEFRKQLIADLRGEAATGDNGAPRTTTRLPKSLARAGGSNIGAERTDHDRHDTSEQAVADAAWR